MPDWDAWGAGELDDWDRDDRYETRKQVVCDECGKTHLRGLIYRNDLETPSRLCPSCCEKHDNHPEVVAEREHLSALEADGDDF